MSSEGHGTATRWSSRVLEVAGFRGEQVLAEHDATCTLVARRGADGERVVLVVLDPTLTRHELQVEAFRRAAEAARAVRHPHLVSLLEVGHDAERDLHYVVCEHVEGRSLAALLEEVERLTEPDAVAIAQTVCDALAAAEDAGLEHGRLSLDAVLIDAEQTPRLAGLGIHHVGGGGSTRTGAAGEAIQFLPPEAGQAVGSAGIRGDLYGVGVILYRMLTGALPWSAHTLAELTELRARVDFPDPRQRVGELSAEVVTVLRGLTARSPDGRYPSARAAALDLVRLMTGQPPVGARGSGAPDTSAFRVPDATTVDAPARPGHDSAFWGKGKAHAFKLILSSREVMLHEYVFNQDLVTIGRSPKSDVHIDNPIVSRRHAQLRREGTSFLVVALSETNATAKNGERVRGQVPVAMGDTITLSDKFRLELQWDPGAAPARADRDLSDLETSAWRKRHLDADSTPPPIDEDDSDEDSGLQPRPPADEDDPYGPASEEEPLPAFLERSPATEPAAATPPPTPAPLAAPERPRPAGDEWRALVPEPAGDLTPSGGVTELGGRTWIPPRGYLVYERSGAQVRSFVERGFQIGRSPACDLRLGGAAPRKAALVVRCSDGYRLFNVADDASLVHLNDEPVADQAVLEHGDRLIVAGVRLLFQAR